MNYPTKTFLAALYFCFASLNAMANPIVAIVDSGVDFRHEDLEENQFINNLEKRNGRDSDRNGYADDISGWNFVTMSPETFAPTNFPYFEEDFYRYYEIRRKRTLKISSEAEDNWYSEKRKDEAFQEKRRLFRRYIHGTHVAGLAAGNGLRQVLKRSKLPQNLIAPEIMAITYLGDTDTGPAAEPVFEPLKKGSNLKKLKHLNSFIKDYLAWQKNKLNLAADYANQFSHVMNASFGISHKSAGNMVKEWWDLQFPESSPKGSSQEKKLLTIQDQFRAGLQKVTKEVVDLYPKLLFIFSAGNTKDDTTVEVHYPSGVKCGHCLTVGASFGTKTRATFSNYGKTSVTLFAPGVAMESSVPEDRKLPVNGTSQAAPQVAFTAANIYAMAWKEGVYINATMVKDILKNSVDKKDFLKNDCESSGIVNPMRAVRLTKYLKSYSLKKAKTMAYKDIQDLDFLPVGATDPTQKSIESAIETPIETD